MFKYVNELSNEIEEFEKNINGLKVKISWIYYILLSFLFKGRKREI